jgi:hypothetical protein
VPSKTPASKKPLKLSTTFSRMGRFARGEMEKLHSSSESYGQWAAIARTWDAAAIHARAHDKALRALRVPS